MKLTRKELKILIENYLLFEQNASDSPEADEEVSDESEEESEEEVSDEADEESDEEESDVSDEADQESDEEESISTSKVITNSLKSAIDSLKNSKPATAIKAIKDQLDTTFKDIEIKSKDLPEDIKKLLRIDNKEDDEIVNSAIKNAVNNAGIVRKAIADENS